MEPHETGLNPYYHQHSALNPHATFGLPTSVSQVTNCGFLPDQPGDLADGANAGALYPQSLAGKVPSPPSEIVRKKRGRPRKYLTPEAAAAAKRASSAAAAALSPSRKRDQQLVGSPRSASSFLKKAQLDSEANNRQCFMPHVISVQPGEDVAQKIRIFVQQSRHELCILSASGSVCNVTLLQQATSGGCITYDGSFDILSLSGSFIHTDHGERSGGLSACLSASNGQVVGGGLSGPLIALGPIEVVVATFLIDTKKDATAGTKGDISITTLASPINTSVSNMGYRPVIEQPARYTVPGVDDHQNTGSFMTQHQGLHMGSTQSDWRNSPDTRSGFKYDFTGIYCPHIFSGQHEITGNVNFSLNNYPFFPFSLNCSKLRSIC
ncbi:hypothetical protein V2J09_022896 [Rumex salicifolius]